MMTNVPTKLWSAPVTPPTPTPTATPGQSRPLTWGDKRTPYNLLKITFILCVCWCIHVTHVYMVHMWRSKDLKSQFFYFTMRVLEIELGSSGSLAYLKRHLTSL